MKTSAKRDINFKISLINETDTARDQITIANSLNREEIWSPIIELAAPRSRIKVTVLHARRYFVSAPADISQYCTVNVYPRVARFHR